MSHDGLGGRRVRHTLAAVSLLVMSSGLSNQTVHAGPPVITMTPSGVRIQAVSSTLSETIDALAKAAGFKLTYDGARPTAPLFNLDIDTPNLSQTLARLLEGQNLNYAILMDRSGTKVTSLMILGSAPKRASTAPGGGSSRPGAFSPPRSPKNDLPPVDDDPVDDNPAEPPPTPTPTPTPAPVPLSPFAPRSPFGNPFPPRPTPKATPSA